MRSTASCRASVGHAREPRRRNTERLLGLFDGHGVTATFFVLGWVAERFPALVADIAQAGHEVASHGYAHRLIYDQTREAFRDDVRRAKDVLESATGVRVDGFRAPSYSVTERTLWALDVLIEEGYRYDASIFPIRHDRYGIPGPRAPARAHARRRVAGRGTGVDGPVRRREPAGRRRRLFPPVAVRVDALGYRSRQPARSGVRPFSICTPGKSTRSSRASPRVWSAGSGTIAISTRPSRGCGSCCAISGSRPCGACSRRSSRKRRAPRRRSGCRA